MALQTNHFRWMEVQEYNGQYYLVRPRSDTFDYEEAVDFQWDIAQEAIVWRNTELQSFEDDLGEIAYINSWVLVHTVNTVIDDEAFED